MKRYVDGWVEFADKRKAKRCALMIHGLPMDPNKRGMLHYDLWNVKYLKGFKWSMLAEKKAHERQVRMRYRGGNDNIISHFSKFVLVYFKQYFHQF